MKMIFRQFNNDSYQNFMNKIVVNSGNGFSRFNEGINLFGWGDETLLRQYVSAFTLEIVYDKT